MSIFWKGEKLDIGEVLEKMEWSERAIGFAHDVLDKLDIPEYEHKNEYSLAARIYLLSLKENEGEK